MADKEGVEILKGLLPIVGIGTVVVVAIGLLGRAFTERRVYAQDGQYLVSVRGPGQWNDIRDFVQPDNPDVVAVCSQYGTDLWSLYDFVCRNIDYRSDVGEFWQTPSETLQGHGDCEDSANLLTSLLRAGQISARTAIGSYQGFGHAWVDRGGQVLETTYTSARPVPDPQDYCPYCLFNDQQVEELWPGALEDIFSLRRNEATKLNLIAATIGDEVPPECPSLWPPLVVGTVMGGILGTGFAMILQKGEEAR